MKASTQALINLWRWSLAPVPAPKDEGVSTMRPDTLAFANLFQELKKLGKWLKLYLLRQCHISPSHYPPCYGLICPSTEDSASFQRDHTSKRGVEEH